MLDQLRSEIEARIQAGHPGIIIDVLDALLAEMTITPDQCSYFINYQSYWRLKSMVTHLTNMFYRDGFNRDYSSFDRDRPTVKYPVENRISIDDGSAIGEIAQRVRNVEKTLNDIRPRRYTNVCKVCDACRSRRRRWPDHAVFIRPQPSVQLL